MNLENVADVVNRDAIAKKLVELRGDKTQNEVSQDVKISVSALSMYETGQRLPRDEVKVALARYYGISVGELFFTN